jgi:calcium/calmodulin-dependent protein kinase I
MRAISHPNIIPLEAVYETDNSYYLILPLLQGGNLKELIVKSGYLSEAECAKILRAILKALIYLHSKNIMHRDIKPDNILFKRTNFQDSDILLADFGLAAYTGINKCSIHRCGTPGFIAPEIINKKEGVMYDNKCDIYSLGIIFFTMLCGKLPFTAIKQDELLAQNAVGFYDFKHHNFENATNQGGIQLI